ncbi:hypothetical protein E8E13_005404 [Curvularia kusanoi]|uniref:Uncharacterized protein n=1 Tax=Curvularia kusanoi TaxID=90978 RepID=A0A9P4T9B4_CURKU|nr:hypothetical protein E8E13_005404 [Curvularia kusanoi]
MSFFEKLPLAQYTTPPNNYIGSTLFLSYIVVALYLTLTISYSLYTQFTSLFRSSPASPFSKSSQNGADQPSIRNARARHIKIYGALALLSFGSISYHMLGFLITSFLDWHGSTSPRNVLAVLSSSNAVSQLKAWMLQTGLFNNFAAELVADPQSAVWAQLAVLSSWGWNLWMGRKALQYNLPLHKTLPFTLLAANLPTSFSAALFIIQLHLSSPDILSSGTPVRQQQKQQQQPAPPKPKPLTSPLLPTILLNAMLLATPTLRNHASFSYLVLAERLLLFLPHTGLLKLSKRDIESSVAVSGGFVVANWAMLRKGLVGPRN